ncbi:hypothetical protein F5Y11DRAFT_346997 [Daldinia sp. FL1419]|nr:hypothetical protein F5Y11DRAFT_346997 [Daldinia sp. FL1419]
MSSREAYQIPSSTGAAGQAAGARSSAFDMDAGVTMHYICGDCGVRFPLRRNDTIRCKECGCRVLYKERTKRLVALPILWFISTLALAQSTQHDGAVRGAVVNYGTEQNRAKW